MTTPSSFILPYDTETTGIFRKSLPHDDPSQPRLCQLSALVVDPEARRVTQSMNLVVQPDGWDIPQVTTDIHGISTEYAQEVGLPERVVLDVFLALWDSRLRIGHNESFDANIIGASIARVYGPESTLFHEWMAAEGDCIMHRAKPIVQARNKKGAVKWPKLSESYAFFFDAPLDNAHSANADVVATMQVWFALEDWER